MEASKGQVRHSGRGRSRSESTGQPTPSLGLQHTVMVAPELRAQAPPLLSCVTLGRWLGLPEPRLLHV